MNLNLDFLLPVLLVTAGVLLVTHRITYIKVHKSDPGYFVLGTGFYLATSGLVFMVTDSNLRLGFVQALTLSFIPCMLLVRMVYRAISDHIKKSNEHWREHPQSTE